MTVVKQLTWDDLKVTTGKAYYGRNEGYKPFQDSRGRIRIHVSLKECSFVCHTFWIKDWSGEATPTQQAVFLLEIYRKLKNVRRRLNLYVL